VSSGTWYGIEFDLFLPDGVEFPEGLEPVEFLHWMLLETPPDVYLDALSVVRQKGSQ
jgi:hypothetical protein